MTRAGLLLAAAAALVYLTAVAVQLNRPLIYDDANFALAARAVAQTGLPYGNQGWMSERGDFSQQDQWALWHPPLYVYLIGLATRLGGWSPPVLRALGVVGGLASGALTYKLAVLLTRGPAEARAMGGGIAAALFLTCPLVIQSTLVVDIDFALLLPLTLLFLLLYVRLEATPRWLWLIPLFAVLLWAKMTNPLPLVGVIGVWQLLRGQFARAAVHVCGIGIGGAALFGASWFAVGRALGFPLDMPFGVNLVQWQDSADVARRAFTSVEAFLEGLQPTVIWLGPGLVALGLLGCGVRGAQLARGWHIRAADLFIGLLAVLVLGYVNKSAGWFPKYEVAMAPLLAILGAPLVAHGWCARRTLVAAAAAIALPAAAVIDVRLVRDSWGLQRTWTLDASAAPWLLSIVASALVAGAVLRCAGPAVLSAIAAVAVGWSVSTDVVQARAAYATTYWYGTTGTAEAAAWIDAHMQPEDVYVAAKEVAIRARSQRYVDQDDLVYFGSVGRPFDGTWAGHAVRAAVVWQREPYVADMLPRELQGFHETARFGDYVVYEPQSAVLR